VLLIWLLIGIPAAIAMGKYTPATFSDDGNIISNEKIVAIEPERWGGKRFPLLPYVEEISGMLKLGQRPLRERLAEGEWIVVLYNHDCPKCAAAIPKYEKLAQRLAARSMAPQVALIEIPPYGDQPLLPSSDTPCTLGRLNDTKVWFLEALVSCRLREGCCMSDEK
jgi:hypothetical protein